MLKLFDNVGDIVDAIQYLDRFWVLSTQNEVRLVKLESIEDSLYIKESWPPEILEDHPGVEWPPKGDTNSKGNPQRD